LELNKKEVVAMAPGREKLLEQMETLAKSYLPEWSFTQKEPDAGSVAALLYIDMLEGNLERFGKVLHKHRVQYLNLFDRFKEEPVESAKSFVQFTPVTGAPEAVHIPKGTRLFADSEGTGQQVIFETVHGITTTPATLSAIYATHGTAGVIERKFSSEEDGSAQDVCFTAFSAGDENLEEHTLLLGFVDSFDHLDRLDIQLSVLYNPENELEKTLAFLCGGEVRFSILCEDGFEVFDKAEREGSGIRLIKEHFLPKKADLSGRQCCQIAITAEKITEVQISGVHVRLSGEDILPDEVRCTGVAQNVGHFRPFGVPMEIYAACEIESKAVFARKGTTVDLSFMLDFETVERLLPEYEVEEEYKVVMRRPAAAPKPSVLDVRADYVLTEYLSETGWKRLIQEEHAAMLFNGSQRGKISLRFVMPTDILREAAAGQPRLRIRLIRSDGLYQIPCVQHCPVISDLRLSYSYSDAPLLPDKVVIRNNFEEIDVTRLLSEEKNVSLFYSREHQKPALYFGFAQNPWGTPVSAYLRLENNADYPVDFTVEYLAPGGFLPLKIADGTFGMIHSGALCMVIPPDAVFGRRFGQELYWIRLINHNKENKSYNLPVINGVYMNMVKVENVHTRTQYFYKDSSDGQTRIDLDEQRLISAKVYVNEEYSQNGENWVLWEVRRHPARQGRQYDIDLAAGRIEFGKTAFATFPVREDGPAIKVLYQTYHGSAANVEAGKISSPASSIRYISEVSNPMPAYGGYDGFNEKTSAAIISNMLRTRGRAVTRQDYFDIICQVSYGVRRIKCVNGQNLKGQPQDDVLTIAILIDEYEKGCHIFSGIKEAIREKLLACSGLIPAGKTLILTQPRFVRMSTRLWLECEKMEDAYDIQKQCGESIRTFIDPLSGGFDGKGWEIGMLPTPAQLVAFLKIRHPGVIVSRMVITALYENREYSVDDQIGKQITNPFAMATNGEHMVYCHLMEV
jgi:hypothetical protein